MRALRVTLLSLALLAAAPAAFTPYLVKDINPEATLEGSSPENLVRLGRSVLFSAEDGEGPALWKSDGTEEGTTVVSRGLPRQRYLTYWTSSASRLFFEVDDPNSTSSSLWTSDGSEAGTLRVTPAGVDVSASWSSAQLGSRAFFSARTAEHGEEPWVSDGTRSGTRRVADLKPGPGSSRPQCFVAYQGKVWFGALSRLWKSDGKRALSVAAFRYKSPDVCPFLTFNGRLLFMVNFRARTEVWSTDGARMHLLDDSRHFEPVPHIVHQGRLWFTDKDFLWSTDGVSSETVLQLPGEEGPNQMMSDGRHLYFCLTQWWDDVSGLWVSDGTEAGTRKISDLVNWSPAPLLNGRLYVSAGYNGTLYKTDGTEAGTRPVRPDGEPDHVARLVLFGNRLIAFTHDGEVWQTDGTAGGTELIRDLSPDTYPSWEVVKTGPRLFFPAFDPESGWELWAIQE